MDSNVKEPPPSRATGVKAMYLLYIAFFAVWCAALAIGEIWTGPDQPALFGMPAWFFIGCIFSFIAVSIALVLCLRRYF